ncbi:MAG: HD domain-containing phosphohydrolase [Candidatus Firestonebacteria bacterium]
MKLTDFQLIFIVTISIVAILFFLFKWRKATKELTILTNLIFPDSFRELSQSVFSRIKKGLLGEKIPLSALSDISNGITSFLTLQEALNLIVDRTMKLMQAEVISIMLLDKNKNELRIKAAKGLSDDVVKNTVIKLGENISGWVAKTGKMLFIPDINKDTRFKATSNPVYKGHSLISVPLKFKNEMIGVLNVTSKSNAEIFNEDDWACLAVIANQSAIVIENAKMYGEICQRARELETILEISQAVISTLNLQEVLQMIINKTIEIMKTPICSLRLLDYEKQELYVQASAGLSEKYLQIGPIKVGESIAGRVAKEKNPIAVSNVKEDIRYKFSNLAIKEGINSILCVPILNKNEMIGVLTVYKTEKHEFSNTEIQLLSTFASECAIAINNARLYENMHKNYFDTIQTLALAVEARDPYTRGHSERVTEYALAISKELKLPERQIQAIKYAGRLHDIGKVGVRDEILLKPGKLTISERADIELHSSKGAEIIKPLDFLKESTPGILHHHERYDGKGYPDRLSKEDIPIVARILAVADTFDAMTSKRPYREPLSVEVALKEIEKHSGDQFDPKIASALINIVKKYNESKDGINLSVG